MERLLKAIALIVAFLIVNSCGEEGPEAGVELEIIPDSPLVVTAPITLPDPTPLNDVDDSITIGDPWFRFSLVIKNDNDEDLNLVVIALKVLVINDRGNEEEYAFAAAEEGNNEYVILAPTISTADDATAIAASGSTDNLGTAPFYIDGFSENSNETRYVYRFRIEPIGWFTKGDITQATTNPDLIGARFRRGYTFSTR